MTMTSHQPARVTLAAVVFMLVATTRAPALHHNHHQQQQQQQQQHPPSTTPPPTTTTPRRSFLSSTVAAGPAMAGLLSSTWAGGRAQPAQAMWQLWFPSDMLEYVNRYATPGSPDSVLAAMDKAAETSWMMNMGVGKGEILETLIAKRYAAAGAGAALPPVTKVLELGTFCGYCTIRMARSLPATASVVTVEKDPKTYAVAREIIGRAGLLTDPEYAEYAERAKAGGFGDHARIEMHLGASGDVIPELGKQHGEGFDFVLMDHWKELYDVDLETLERLRLVRKNSAVLADNVRLPGAPRYLDYLYHGRGALRWDTAVIDVPFEYRPETPDAMTYSVYRGSGDGAASGGTARTSLPPPREPCNLESPQGMRSAVDRLICEAELNSPNDGSGAVDGG